MPQIRWYYTNDRTHGSGEGPVNRVALDALRKAGTVLPQTLLWCEGMPDWRPASELEHLFAPPAASSEATSTDAIVEEEAALYAALVGPNFGIYRERWQLDQPPPRTRPTWHWPGFLFGVLWMMYRKMHRVAVLWMSAMFVLNVVENLLRVPPVFSLAITLGLNAFVATKANDWYLAHCRRQLVLAQGSAAGDQARLGIELEQRGGTSIGGVFIGLGMALAVAALSAVLVR
ncbi:DUF2628 domain-containing protein [Stenotrophomonas sepilia]|jgi:hypothetical protein|uniref:DUF2628 domain-containing protein n=1 Tax=Stenotrophomonas sepilia TaxID=2860290 RepID=UPI002FE5F7A5